MICFVILDAILLASAYLAAVHMVCGEKEVLEDGELIELEADNA